MVHISHKNGYLTHFLDAHITMDHSTNFQTNNWTFRFTWVVWATIWEWVGSMWKKSAHHTHEYCNHKLESSLCPSLSLSSPFSSPLDLSPSLPSSYFFSLEFYLFSILFSSPNRSLLLLQKNFHLSRLPLAIFSLFYFANKSLLLLLVWSIVVPLLLAVG